MEREKKKMRLTGEEDKVRNVSELLIGLVVERLPIEEAVKTSMVCRKWRHGWTAMNSLVFDEPLCTKLAMHEPFDSKGLIRTINQVMLVMKGHIRKFYVHIPLINPDSFQDVDVWMLVLSRNGVQELTLTFANRPYEMSSHLFSCSELKKLKLDNCTFRTQLEFERLSALEDLHLKNVDFGAKPCSNMVRFSKLQNLALFGCTNVQNFNIDARNLHTLAVIITPTVSLLPLLERLLGSRFITTLFLCFAEPIEAPQTVRRMNFAVILSNLPVIQKLVLDGNFLKFLGPESFPKWLPQRITSLKRCLLVHVRLSDMDELNGVLCLLRNSVNLEFLRLRLKKVEAIDYDVAPASNHLESPDVQDQTLNRLEYVEIKCLEGSKPELLFVKLILEHSPSLKKITVEPSGATDIRKRTDIAVNLLWCSRASTAAEFCYLV